MKYKIEVEVDFGDTAARFDSEITVENMREDFEHDAVQFNPGVREATATWKKVN